MFWKKRLYSQRKMFRKCFVLPGELKGPESVLKVAGTVAETVPPHPRQNPQATGLNIKVLSSANICYFFLSQYMNRYPYSNLGWVNVYTPILKSPPPPPRSLCGIKEVTKDQTGDARTFRILWCCYKLTRDILPGADPRGAGGTFSSPGSVDLKIFIGTFLFPSPLDTHYLK